MNLLVLIFTWLIYFIPALAIELVCYLLAPIVACFITTRDRFDVVKRQDKRMVLLPRDYIIKPLYWFQTHDNAVDEWWYGLYNVDHWFAFARDWTQADYDNSRFVRWYCRVMWLWRNCAYGFLYAIFSKPHDVYMTAKKWTKGVENKGFWLELVQRPSSFQLEMHVPLGYRYLTINIGWKAHKNTLKLLYANRIIGFRKYK